MKRAFISRCDRLPARCQAPVRALAPAPSLDGAGASACGLIAASAASSLWRAAPQWGVRPLGE